MRVHGAVRVLARREGLPEGLALDRTGIEDIMLLLTKGRRCNEGLLIKTR